MEEQINPHLPPTDLNLKAYQLIFEIESVLRELLIEHGERSMGPRWHAEVLPSSTRQRLNEALREGAARRQKDDGKTWTSRRAFHPVYFIELGDLADTFRMRANKSLDALCVASEREAVSEQLLRLLPIRNAVAHMRLIASSDLLQIQTAHSLLASTVGRDTFARLARELPSQRLVTREMAELAGCLSTASQAIEQIEAVDLAVWRRLQARWWLDDSWHVDSRSIRMAAELCVAYDVEFCRDVVMRRMRMERWTKQHWDPNLLNLARASLTREISDD